MIAALLVVLAAAAPPTPTTAPSTSPATLPAQHETAAAALADEFRARLKAARYMEQGEGRPIEIPGWEGFPTRRYTYTVTDKADGVKKSADVILLDPSAEQIARWIVSALVEVRGAYDAEAARKIFRHILAQSGGQFPVAGVVYEDILPANGKNEIFCFRDGVTVAIDGVPHRGTAPLTPEQIEASIGGKVTTIFTYARIASTSPKMWSASRSAGRTGEGGADNANDAAAAAANAAVLGPDGKPTEKWPETIRAAYQAAWTSDRNVLLVAWVSGTR